MKYLLTIVTALLTGCAPESGLVENAIRTVSEVEASGRAAVGRYADQDLAAIGFLDATKAPYSADPTGETDSTTAIQRAIRDARDARLVTYLPAGRYLVSDTIEGAVGVVKWDEWPYDGWTDPWESEASFEYPCVLIGAAEGERSVLVLADDAPGFDKVDDPKPVLYFWARSMQVPGVEIAPPDEPQSNINFNQKIHHLDIHLGSGNPGAVGIDHRGAEGATVEDVTVEAEGAFAGFRHAPGSGGAMHGIRVNGGRFGIYMDGSQPSPLISDLTLRGQTEASILGVSRGPLTIVGAKIDGAGILCRRGSMFFDGSLNIVDSVIRIRNDQAAVTTPRSAVLENVWIHGTETAVQVADYPPVTVHKDGWTQVVRYAAGSEENLSEQFDGQTWRATVWLNKKRIDKPLVDIRISASEPPAEVTAQHDLPPMPGLETLRAASVKSAQWGAKGDGTADDAEAIQRAIDAGGLVFLPKGRYAVSKPLRLGPSTKLIGVSNLLSQIEDGGADGAFSDPSNPEPLIDTVDDAAATTTLAMVRLHTDVRNASVYSFRWRAGRDSVVRNVYPSRSPWHPNASAMNHPMALIDGNGGGHWYTQTFLGGWSQGPDFRFLRVDGTREPLRFYHLQVQFGRGNAMVEMSDVRDVDIFSMKSEGDFTMLWLRQSQNVRLFGHNGLNMAAPGWSVVRLEDCGNTTLTQLQPMVTRVGFYVGHLVNYDPRRWFILSDGSPIAGGLEQVAFYRVD
jgi:pectate lyase-like protein